MNILLKKVIVADPLSGFNGTVTDILIHNGVIQLMAENIEQEADSTLTFNGNVYVSPGWTDLFAHFADPGFEHKETLLSGAASAVAGGYTQVMVLPNTNPPVTNKTGVEYIVQKSKLLPVSILPLGAISKNADGKELSEMYDMYNSGAVAFTDGLQPMQSADLLLKALQYVKTFDGVILQVPADKSISGGGLMNEGIVSTRLGLPGIPAIGEELMIKRDLALLHYTGSRLHFTGISTATGVELIREAKQKGARVTCSATPYHLYFCDEDLTGYDTNLKVSPPLRSAADREAVRNAVLDGTVDCIATHHIPQHWDDKICEFEYAKNGMIGLQTSFAAINTVLPQLTIDRLIQLFSIQARKIVHLPQATIAEGKVAELTLFSRDEQSRLTKQSLKSISANTPFLETTLQGKVLGTITNGVFNA